MSHLYQDESLLEVFIYETLQNIEQLETVVLVSEKHNRYSADLINEVFRIMHTIKGSSAMMLFDNLSSLAHRMEDLFFYLRDVKPLEIDFLVLSDLVLAGVDFIKDEMQKIQAGLAADGDATDLMRSIEEFLVYIQEENKTATKTHQSVTEVNPPDESVRKMDTEGHLIAYEAVIYFEDGCEMENVRAYGVVQELQKWVEDLYFSPEDILENDDSVHIIRSEGFTVGVYTSKTYEELQQFFSDILFLKDLKLRQLELTEFQLAKHNDSVSEELENTCLDEEEPDRDSSVASAAQKMISVNVGKLDKLMDLVGEMIIAESMVTQNPGLQGLELQNFKQAARHLHKITKEIQDTVMSVRMVPIYPTFLKMQRIVRDMSKKLQKEVQLQLIGEETEVDKNIIEHISDPLMHLIRNSIDHGLEPTEERISKGKATTGTITLEARNVGSYVLVLVKDDGKGLNKTKILQRARQKNLLTKPETELTDREIYSLIFLPGFSTNDTITEYSGRGVGMDVVAKNLKIIGGTVVVESVEGQGTIFILKIPLTLAIIEGLNLHVGKVCYTIPITSVRESLRLMNNKIVTDPDGNEMIMIRGQCYPIIRLHEYYAVKTDITELAKGIFILIEHDEQPYCLFADDLFGKQEFVVKALPNYIRKNHKVMGIGGCAILGDGSLSLILDAGGFVSH